MVKPFIVVSAYWRMMLARIWGCLQHSGRSINSVFSFLTTRDSDLLSNNYDIIHITFTMFILFVCIFDFSINYSQGDSFFVCARMAHCYYR